MHTSIFINTKLILRLILLFTFLKPHAGYSSNDDLEWFVQKIVEICSALKSDHVEGILTMYKSRDWYVEKLKEDNDESSARMISLLENFDVDTKIVAADVKAILDSGRSNFQEYDSPKVMIDKLTEIVNTVQCSHLQKFISANAKAIDGQVLPLEREHNVN